MLNPISVIESNCRQLAESRGKLRRKFELRQKAVNEATRQFDREIRELQGECDCTRAAIMANLETCREMFVGRKTGKTREFAGIVVGFEKERDKMIMPDETTLIDRIGKQLPATVAETLLDRSVRVIKDAFKKLPRATHQALGCSIVTGADQPIVRANDDDIETLVKKQLGQAQATTEAVS
jgi:hypothetical protein